MQITLAVDKDLTYRQDSAPDWLNKSSRQLVFAYTDKEAPDWLHNQE